MYCTDQFGLVVARGLGPATVGKYSLEYSLVGITWWTDCENHRDSSRSGCIMTEGQ